MATTAHKLRVTSLVEGEGYTLSDEYSDRLWGDILTLVLYSLIGLFYLSVSESSAARSSDTLSRLSSIPT